MSVGLALIIVGIVVAFLVGHGLGLVLTLIGAVLLVAGR